MTTTFRCVHTLDIKHVINYLSRPSTLNIYTITIGQQ